jgi:hypothetical protein
MKTSVWLFLVNDILWKTCSLCKTLFGAPGYMVKIPAIQQHSPPLLSTALVQSKKQKEEVRIPSLLEEQRRLHCRSHLRNEIDFRRWR